MGRANMGLIVRPIIFMKADFGARKNGGNGGAVGQRGNARGRYKAIGRKYTVTMVLPNASDPHNITFVCLFA